MSYRDIHIEERATEIANYIIDNKCTIRDAAKKFKISKSTVHLDVTSRLKELNPSLYKKIRVILDMNLDERPYKGGEATKNKYKLIKNGYV